MYAKKHDWFVLKLVTIQSVIFARFDSDSWSFPMWTYLQFLVRWDIVKLYGVDSDESTDTLFFKQSTTSLQWFLL